MQAVHSPDNHVPPYLYTSHYGNNLIISRQARSSQKDVKATGALKPFLTETHKSFSGFNFLRNDLEPIFSEKLTFLFTSKIERQLNI